MGKIKERKGKREKGENEKAPRGLAGGPLSSQ